MKTKLAAVAILLGLAVAAAAQSTGVNSTETRVNNGAPSDVFFNFPISADNVEMVQFACSGSSVNANHVYVYELQANGFINTYFFAEPIIECDEQYGTDIHGLTTLIASLVGTITVTTPDHTITIGPANWTATHKMSRTGYYWQANPGGGATITIDQVIPATHCAGPCGS